MNNSFGNIEKLKADFLGVADNLQANSKLIIMPRLRIEKVPSSFVCFVPFVVKSLFFSRQERKTPRRLLTTKITKGTKMDCITKSSFVIYVLYVVKSLFSSFRNSFSISLFDFIPLRVFPLSLATSSCYFFKTVP